MFHPVNAAAPWRARRLSRSPHPFRRQQADTLVSVGGRSAFAQMRINITPGVGSFPCASEAGNPSLIRCVVSGAGSY